jgi:Ca2+-binding RTX toxin-like protein
MSRARGRKRQAALLAAATTALLLALATTASARAPIIAFVEQGTLKQYDAETEKFLAPVPIPVTSVQQFRYGISQNGRYVVFNDENRDLHLFDRQRRRELPLPGINVYNNPAFPSVSNGGRIAFDDNGNGPALVYDGIAGAFLPTGFPANNDHRQPQINGGGALLATTCPGPDCAVNLGNDSNPFVQDLQALGDTGVPDDDNEDEEDPCISGSGRFVGWHKGNPMQKDVFLFDRRDGTLAAPPGMNDPVLDDTFCVLDVAGDYVGFMRENDPVMRLYQRDDGELIPLPSAVGPRDNNIGNLFSAPRCSRRYADVIGSEGKDVLKGTKRSEVFLGLEGKDRISGRGGNDVICGGDGRDDLSGGKGKDRILGEKGSDDLAGGGGKDVLKGGKGRDDERQ